MHTAWCTLPAAGPHARTSDARHQYEGRSVSPGTCTQPHFAGIHQRSAAAQARVRVTLLAHLLMAMLGMLCISCRPDFRLGAKGAAEILGHAWVKQAVAF
jgi:hypothetical protein